MIRKSIISKIIIATLISIFFFTHSVLSQENSIKISGTILESVTNNPLPQVLVSVADTNIISNSDENGKFELSVNNPLAEIILLLPGYDNRSIFLNGRTSLTIYMVKTNQKSMDDLIVKPMGNENIKNSSNAINYLTIPEINYSSYSSLDQAIQGKVPGVRIVTHSAMPGSKSWIGIRGISSLTGRNEPCVMIDGMIHDISVSRYSAIDGFSHNMMDLIDIEDVESITMLKDAQSYLGSLASNGVVYINTEQKKETSTAINVNVYGGVTMTPSKQSVLNAGEYKTYFNELLRSQNLNQDNINKLYPWLNGGVGTGEYYRYNNNTSWQDEIFRNSIVQKYHIFLKGGDDIATYNISTGYLRHGGILKNTYYSRYNLRINGKINITDRFSITPHAKLSLSDSYLMEQGYNQVSNPIYTALLKPPIMAPYTKNEETGEKLRFLDDIGVFNISNPTSVVTNSEMKNRSYIFLTSAKAQYNINDKLSLTTTVGIDFNNSRDNVFIPDKGLARIDSAYNTIKLMVTDFRSMQNHNVITYTDKFNGLHRIKAQIGHRYMSNTYEWDNGNDLNSITDDFKSLGQGASDEYLRSTKGISRSLKWVSYFGNFNYQYLDKYYVNLAVAYDGASLLNSENRYNILPSLSGAWRLSSESFLSDKTWLSDLKLRGSFGITGNINNTVYDYSKLYYVGKRFEDLGVIVRESVPNSELSLEKKYTANIGVDLSLKGQTFNFSLDYYMENIPNLIIHQRLTPAFGFENYFDNGGKLSSSGIEFYADARKKLGDVFWNIGLTVSKHTSTIKSLEFITNPNNLDYVITKVHGGEMITKENNPAYMFYGYETNGIYTSAGEANAVTGPNGNICQEGDVRFVDKDGNNVIDYRDKTIIGNPNPELFGGLFTSLEFGNFNIKVDFTYCIGNDIYNYLGKVSKSMDSYSNQLADVKDRRSGDMPGAAIGDPTGNNVFSDRWIESGTYVKLKQLTVGYTIPAESKFYKRLSVYLTGSNLLTLTQYSGYDPEFLYMNEPVLMGIDYGKMPSSRSVIIGIKLGL